eukprot:COSAG01_NODE_1064_length_11885_cov_7.744358_16_plen_89_part_01
MTGNHVRMGRCVTGKHIIFSYRQPSASRIAIAARTTSQKPLASRFTSYRCNMCDNTRVVITGSFFYFYRRIEVQIKLPFGRATWANFDP